MHIGDPVPARRAFALLAVCGCLMMAVALFMQYAMELEPCPLCILQRIALLATIPPLLAGAWLAPGRVAAATCAGCALPAALAGAGLAGRHLWLQQLPPEAVPECGPGLEYLFDTLPFGEALMHALRGSGECAEESWSLLSISIPGWTLMGFSLLAAGCALLLAGILRRPR